MDQSNPAVLRHTDVTPLLLDAVAEDPSILQGIATKMAMVQIDRVHRIMDNPAIPVAQRLATIEMLSKIGQIGAYTKAAQQPNGGAQGFSVNIIIEPNAKRQSITVDTEAKTISPPTETQATTSSDTQLVEIVNGGD